MRILSITAFWVLVALSACILVAAFLFSYQLFHLPYGAVMECLQLIQATLFSYGFGLGLLGSVLALSAPNIQKGYGLAATIHGCGFLVLAFVAEHSLEQRAMGYKQPAGLMLLPCTILALSILLFLQTWRKHRSVQQKELPTEEAQHTLSQP